MDIRLKLLYLCTTFFMVIQLSACAMNGRESGQLLPEESRATPELALLNERARLADVGGEAAQAESLYKAVLRQTPNDTETWFRLGNLYANNNRAAEAAIAYERTIISDNSHIRAWHNLSIIRLRQSYAALLQAQVLADDSDPMSARIDSALEQLSKLTILENEPKPSVSRPVVEPGNSASGSIVGEPEVPAPGNTAIDELAK